MANTTVATSHAIAVERFQAGVFQEYLARNVLTKYMGTSPTAMVHVNEDLRKAKGDAITFNLAMALSGAGVEGDSTLEGNEEALTFHGQRVLLNQYSNAVRDAGALTRQRTPFELLEYFKPSLVEWLAQKSEKLAFQQMHAMGGVIYASADEAGKDAWVAANADRVLFGAAVANNAANDHSANLATIDATDDILDTEQLSLAIRLAKLATPKIRPIKLVGGEEVYVFAGNPRAIRDLKKDPAYVAAQTNAMPRGDDNPIFTGALGMWDGAIIVETERAPLLTGVGAGGIDVAVGFLCGAQALLYAQGGYERGEKVKMVEETFDYTRQNGCAIMSLFEINKAVFNGKDHGIFTVYSSGVAD